MTDCINHGLFDKYEILLPNLILSIYGFILNLLSIVYLKESQIYLKHKKNLKENQSIEFIENYRVSYRDIMFMSLLMIFYHVLKIH